METTYEKIDDEYLFQFLFTFIIAFILSAISLGFFFFIFIYFILEVFHFYRYGRADPYYVLLRFSIFLFGVFGFVLGRILLMNDHNPFRHSFHEWL